MKKLLFAILLAVLVSGTASAKPKVDWAKEIQVRPILRMRIFAQISGHSVTLSWTASTSAACLTATPPTCSAFGYNIFRGTAAGAESLTPLNSSPLTILTFVDPITLTSNPQAFFYFIEAVETTGTITVSSVPSSEVSATFPGIPASPSSVVATPK
jgi:hypothetical protein